MRKFFWLTLILLTACAPATETAAPPQPSPETAVLPTNTVPPPVIEEAPVITEATAVPNPTQPATDLTPTTAVAAEPTAAELTAEAGVTSGRTEEGAFFLGDPDAPITHIDYSDFL